MKITMGISIEVVEEAFLYFKEILPSVTTLLIRAVRKAINKFLAKLETIAMRTKFDVNNNNNNTSSNRMVGVDLSHLAHTRCP